MKKSKVLLLAVVLITGVTVSCTKKGDPAPLAASLTTSASTAIAITTATSGGNVTSDGGSPVIARGVCWGTNASPTVADSKTIDGAGIGTFTSSIEGLTAATTYNVRAYASNSVGTAYGNAISFTTAAPVVASLTTSAPIFIIKNSATSGGNVTADGGAAVIARGVCWSTSANPTVADSKTNDGAGMGNFTSGITGLAAGVTYNVRSYATNIAGTAYGNAISFTTLQLTDLNDVDGNIYHSIKIGSQEWMIENLKVTRYNDGTSIPLPLGVAGWASQSTGAYCWYNDDALNNKNTYGALYNWYAVNTGKLCPSGWHVPSDGDWNILLNYLIAPVAGKLKEAGTSHWQSPNAGATNESGFTALPGGFRSVDGGFVFVGQWSYWWSSTEVTGGGGNIGLGFAYSDGWFGNNNSKGMGYSVRCVKD